MLQLYFLRNKSLTFLLTYLCMLSPPSFQNSIYYKIEIFEEEKFYFIRSIYLWFFFWILYSRIRIRSWLALYPTSIYAKSKKVMYIKRIQVLFNPLSAELCRLYFVHAFQSISPLNFHTDSYIEISF